MDSKFSNNASLLLQLLLVFSLLCSTVTAGSEELRVGYYGYTCPRAEIIVRRAVNKAVTVNPGIAAGLIRMHYHDCFVRGCDGSVLLDPVPGKPDPEKSNRVNSPSLRGFEVIDEAKAEIEVICPGIVSCADIIAFAARDSVINTGWIAYGVPSGRRDGCVSLSPEVSVNLPGRSYNATQLRDSFIAKGLSLDEMVTLSGAHSIGVSHCSSFSNRLGSINTTQDPSLDPSYATFLRTQCPTSDLVVNNDFQTPTVLDKKYYGNLEQRKGLLTSDQTLYTSPLTRKLVKINAKYGAFWAKKFAAAMVHMGTIDVLTGNQGEIRKNCRLIN